MDNITNHKKSGFKWVVIGGTVMVAIIIVLIVLFIIKPFNKSYKVANENDYHKIIEKIFDANKSDAPVSDVEWALDCDVKDVNKAFITTTDDGISATSLWVKFNDEDIAEEVFKEIRDEFNDEQESWDEELEDMQKEVECEGGKFKIKNNEHESTAGFCKFYAHINAEYDKEEVDLITYTLIAHDGDVVAYIRIYSEEIDAVEFINKIEKGLK